MCAFKKEERCVLISVTLMTGIAGYNTVPTIDITFCMYVKGPTMWQRLERKISFLNCLFVYFFFFCHPHFSFSFLLLFLLSSSFFPSAFFYPHFPIRIRHPQVSGPRFTDPVAWVGSVQPKCTVLLSTWTFRNFRPEFLLNEKCPKFFQIWSSVTGYGKLNVCF